MPKQICLSIVAELSDDLFDAADQTKALGGPWTQLLEALKDAGVKYQAQCETLETRAKPAGVKRGRKPKVAQIAAPVAELAA